VNDPEALQARYAELKQEAARKAGGLLEIPRRVAILHELFRDSGGNHVFPLIAAHGALWAFSYFEMGGSLGRLIALRYCYSQTERIYRLDILREFAEKFRQVNRQVCIDSYANYHFARELGDQPGADQVVPPELLETLNRVHAARRHQRELPAEQKREVFQQSFRCEQELTVAPGVQAAIAEFECKIMQFLCLRPVVRFTYFPALRYFFFRNFGNKDERIAKGLQAYELADRAGSSRVCDSLLLYGHIPRRLLDDPQGYLNDCLTGDWGGK